MATSAADRDGEPELNGPSDLTEENVQGLLNRPFTQLRFPAMLEQPFRAHSRQQAAQLLTRSIYGLIGIYLLVVVPIGLSSDDPGLGLWRNSVLLPIGAVLGLIWVCTRSPRMLKQVEKILAAGVFTCLTGSIYCSIHLGNSAFGMIASFEVIYILIIAFALLHLPVKTATLASLSALLVNLIIAFIEQAPVYLLPLLLYFIVPALICAVTGYMLERSNRHNYLQQLLLQMESAHLARLHKQAEKEAAKQHFYNEYLELIAGNLSENEIFTRTLGFLVQASQAHIGTAHRVLPSGLLQARSNWGGDPASLRNAENLRPEETLMGAALQQRQPIILRDLPPDYLDIRTGTSRMTPAEVMILPVFHEKKAIAVIELGRVNPFPEEQLEKLESILPSLAYALLAADARRLVTAQRNFQAVASA